MSHVTIIIGDPNPRSRFDIELALRSFRGVEVTDSCSSDDVVRKALAQKTPDLLLLDYQLARKAQFDPALHAPLTVYLVERNHFLTREDLVKQGTPFLLKPVSAAALGAVIPRKEDDAGADAAVARG